MQVNKKALYIENNGAYIVIKSYDTPIILIHDNKLITSDIKYSTTTSKHKNYIMREYNHLQAITINHKTFKNILIDNDIPLGIA